jgi:hypothetical protein
MGLSIGVLLGAAILHGDGPRQEMQVTVQVVRSCSVRTSPAGSTVNCGAKPSTESSSSTDRRPVITTSTSDSNTRVVTVNF